MAAPVDACHMLIFNLLESNQYNKHNSKQTHSHKMRISLFQIYAINAITKHVACKLSPMLSCYPCQGIIDKSAFSFPNIKDLFQHRRRRERQAFALAYERRGLGQVGRAFVP